MTEKELKIRTKKFAVAILNLVDELPNKRSANIIGNQLGRSASSIASNYRAACRARSHAEFISKIGIVEEEADESQYFLELLAEFNPKRKNELRTLYKEGNEILSMTVASINTTLKNLAK